MKKVFSLLITLAMLVSTAVVPMSVSADTSVWDGTADTAFEGEGTAEKPYLITSAAELAGLASNVNGGNNYSGKYFKITNNIDLTNTANADWTPIGDFSDDLPFNGTLDGAGHVISGVQMTSCQNSMGLFGYIGSNGKVSKLGVNGVDIQFENNSDSTLRCNQAGGFVAYLAGTVEKCYAKNVTIKNTNNIAEGANGGFVGRSKGTLTDCYSYNVNLAGSMYCIRGGFVSSAENYDPQATNCWSANVTQEKLNITNASSMYGFGKERVSTSREGNFGSNCYTTAANDPTTLENAICETTTKEDLIAGLVTSGSSYVLTGASVTENDGYPALAWEDKTIWDGTTLDTVWDGEGTQANPYLITSAAELAGLANKTYNATSASTDVPVKHSYGERVYNAYTGVYFKLTADINLNNKEWTPIGRMNMRFNGYFDGGKHVVSNLDMKTNHFGMGLFGATDNDASISNLGVIGARFDYHCNPSGKVADLKTGEGVDVTWSKAIHFGGGELDRTYAVGALIGTISGGTVENCFAKDVYINNSGSYQMNAGGLIGGVAATDLFATSRDKTTATIKNCYVNGITHEENSNIRQKGGLYGSTASSNSSHTLGAYINSENCYVSNITGETDAFGDNRHAAGTVTKCYSTGTGNDNTAAVKSATVDTIAKALVTGNNAWNLDRVENPTNGGYPILGWEKWWTTESDPLSSFKGAGVTVADGFVTDATVVQNDSAVLGTVVVAVYTGDRFKSAVTAKAVNGVIDIEDMAVATGDTVKVLVWETDTLSPLALVYSTTVQ